jgi:5-methyltetrahydrofolate--homocysteine methyltransferase
MSDLLGPITTAVIDGESETISELVTKALQAPLEPLEIINQGLIPGMDVVGRRFSEGECFLPHLIMAAAAMEAAMKILEPELAARKQTVANAGTVVIGTVSGDIHEIGKSLVGTMLSVHGFQVHDLGVDVPVEKFLRAVRETGANLIGMSALLTTTMEVQREVIRALEDAGLRGQVKVLVGGAPVSAEWASEIGADGYAEDAIGAVQLALKLS